MSFTKKTIKDIKLDGKTVLVSVDYNVPGDENGKVTDTYRILKSIPTIEYLVSKKCKVVLISHRNRPGGKYVKKDSLKLVAEELEKLLKCPVKFAEDCAGPAAKKAKEQLKPGEVLLCENTRFHVEEEKNDSKFAKELAADADVFVQEAFGNAHRKHASTDGVTKYLPSVAGLLLEKEVDTITDFMQNPNRPLMAIIGGAKIADKIDILNRFIDIADFVAVGGAMANTFLKAEDIDIGKSLWDEKDLPLAEQIIEKAKKEAKKRHFVFYLPQDGVVAKTINKTTHTRIVDWDAHVIASIENYPKKPPHRSGDLLANERILDVGPFSAAFITGAMQMMNTVIWNGTLGVAEVDGITGPVGPFAHGTETIIEGMLGEFGHRPKSLVGGGDTSGYIQERGLIESFDHVSSGGGASLDLMSGKKLPAVEALLKK